MTKRIAIVQGHPDPLGGHYCHALAAAYASGAHEAGHVVEIVSVGALEFPFIRSRKDLESCPVPEPIRSAQDVLRRADHVALFFPIWNGGVPALLLAFFEQVFRTDFVFPDWKPGDPRGFSTYFRQRKGLAGRSARIVATMQMPGLLYRLYFHPHRQKNVFRLSGLKPVRETHVGFAESRDSRRREMWLDHVHALGQRAR